MRPGKRPGGFAPIGERPAWHIELQDITLPDGTVLKDFPVKVIEPGFDGLGDNEAQPGYVDEHGRVPTRGSGT